MKSPKSRSGSDSDVESDTSYTILMEKIPFNTFRFHVINFFLLKICPYATADEVVVEHLSGCEKNRVISVSWQPDGKPDFRGRYIIRIPRFDAAQLNHQLATLRFLRLLGNIPVPVVLTFDNTDDNLLGSKYMVQNYIPGTTLLSSYPSLTHEERCRVARELGRIYHELLATRSDALGFLTLPRGDTDYSDSPTPRDVHRLLIKIFLSRWGRLDRLLCRSHPLARLGDNFCYMALELAAGGWFANCHISLAHLDLEPHNILVNPTSDTRLPIISAVLGWDSAVFVPQFMCCQPPMWLWAWKNNEDRRHANETPPTPEGCQIKQLFEEAAGPDYLRFAYCPAYRLARRLVRFAVEGVRSYEDYVEAGRMLEEWIAVRTP
ncbi:hypothetical protein F4781DRAFT_424605 [Annulohypoxylon bovei var. microspora]|nr:hypothetical protein F4781DRAFT_424605 [Annulohypoxylon bovei var. microspora]